MRTTGAGGRPEQLPPEKAFYFYTDIGRYTGRFASSLAGFAETLRDIEVASIEFHLARGDFENWLGSIGEKALARRAARLRARKLSGENLRNELKMMIDKRVQERRQRGKT